MYIIENDADIFVFLNNSKVHSKEWTQYYVYSMFCAGLCPQLLDIFHQQGSQPPYLLTVHFVIYSQGRGGGGGGGMEGLLGFICR